MESVKFSIIIPAYNVEKYIKQCIESVLSQTYKNFEVIVVNDGSTDDTPEIIDNFASKNSRIECIHKMNGGLSDARNTGLDKATGDYIIFLDSDDYWNESTFLEDIAQTLKKRPYDCIIFNSYKTNKENINTKSRFSRMTKTEPQSISLKSSVENGIYKACAWDKVIKKSILISNDIYFIKGQLSEDISWASLLLEKIKSVAIYTSPVYAYRQRSNSISHTVSSKHLSDILSQIEEGCAPNTSPTILSYYAYEYSVFLGLAHRSRELTQRTKNLSWLLDYDKNPKVKKVHLCYKLLGFTLTKEIASIFIKLKSFRFKK